MNNDIKDRNPMHEMGAGQIATQLNHDNKEGALIGADSLLAELNQVESMKKSESGLFTGERDNPVRQVQAAFNDFVNKKYRSIYAKIRPGWIEIELFMARLNHTKYTNSYNYTQYNHIIWPLAKVINVSEISEFTLGDLVIMPAEIKEYGINPVWQQWYDKRNDSVNMDKTEAEYMASIEPPKFGGDMIDEYTRKYGVPTNIFDTSGIFATRFLIYESVIRGVYNIAELESDFANAIAAVDEEIKNEN